MLILKLNILDETSFVIVTLVNLLDVNSWWIRNESLNPKINGMRNEILRIPHITLLHHEWIIVNIIVYLNLIQGLDVSHYQSVLIPLLLHLPLLLVHHLRVMPLEVVIVRSGIGYNTCWGQHILLVLLDSSLNFVLEVIIDDSGNRFLWVLPWLWP